MGNLESTFIKVCGSAIKRPRNYASPEHEEENNHFIERNKDNYFQKDDFNTIVERFPDFRDWMEQSTTPSSKEKPKHKRIRWKQGEVIGHGSFGKVVMGLNLESGCMMAVKQVQIGMVNTSAQQERIKALEVEIELLSQFSHKNIVRYYGSDRTKDTFNIFLEYISGGTIASLLDKYGPFNENLIRVYTRQILEGLEYLHVRNTIHRDIKGANVLVDNSGVCKLTDFGTAKRISSIVESDSKYLPSIRGTVNWMAPEVIKQTTLGRYCDIWSVGCTVLEMATGQAPWSMLLKPDANSVSLLYQIAQAKSAPPVPKTLSNEALDFLKQCFKINPQERPNVIKLLNHKFISCVENIPKSLEMKTGDKPYKSAQSFFQKTFNLSPDHTKKIKQRKRDRYAPKNKSVSSQGSNLSDNQFPENIKDIVDPTKKEGARSAREGVTKVSIYDFGMAFPGSQPRTQPDLMNRKTQSSNAQTPEDGSMPKLTKSGRSSLLKDFSNDDTSKSGQISSLPGFGLTDRSELESIGTVRTHPDGIRTIHTLQEEDREAEINKKARFDHRRLVTESKTRMRPLGRNKRASLKKLLHSDLSGDESMGGNSFLLLGSPGTNHENSEDRGLYTRGGGNNSSMFTANQSGFPWPETLSQIDENEITYEGKDNTISPVRGKIEEEEEDKDADSEQEKEEVMIESDKEEEGDNNENHYPLNTSVVHSNPEMYTLETERNENGIFNKNENPDKESRAFSSSPLTKSFAKKRAHSQVKDQERKMSSNAGSPPARRLASANMAGTGGSSIVDGFALVRNNSTPGSRSHPNNVDIDQLMKQFGTQANNQKPEEDRGRVYQLPQKGKRISHSQDPQSIDLLDQLNKEKYIF